MIEVAIAAFLPAAALLIATLRWGDKGFRRASRGWFVPLTLLWFAPWWLTGSSPAPLGFLSGKILPWAATPQPEALQPNALLSDITMQFLPWRDLVVAAYRSGELPLLNRFAGAGSPLWENPQAAVLFPLTLIGIPFSTFAWPLFAGATKILLALTGTYLFLRSEGRSHSAGVFGAVAFGFGAPTFVFLFFPHTNVTVLLPWMLLAIRNVDRFPAAAGGCTALLLLGGHPESVFHVALLALPFAIREVMRRDGSRARTFRMLAAAAIVGALLAAPVVLPFLRLLPDTDRMARTKSDQSYVSSPAVSVQNVLPFAFASHVHYTRFRVEGANFSELAAQYSGFAAFVLCAYAWWFGARALRFWIVAFVTFLPLAFHIPGIEGLIRAVPIVGAGTLHGRIRIILGFIVAVSAAFGLDLLIARWRTGSPDVRPHGSVRWISLAIAVSGVVIAASIAGGWDRFRALELSSIVAISAWLAVFSAALLLLVAVKSREALPMVAPAVRPDHLIALLVMAAFADVAAVGRASYPPSPRSLDFPKTPLIAFLERQAGEPFRFVGIGNVLFPNTTARFGLEDIRAHDPVAYERYLRVLGEAGLDREAYFQMFQNLPPRRLLDLLGVRYVVVPPGVKGPIPAVYEGPDGTILENATALPRFRGRADVRLESYKASSAVVSVSGVAATTIETGEVALPGWRLEKDGRPWPLRSHDSAFLAWEAPPGRSRFELRYEPPGLRTGAWLAAAGFVALVLLFRRGQQAAAGSAGVPPAAGERLARR